MELLAECALNTHGLCGERALLWGRSGYGFSFPPLSLEVNKNKSSADKEA